MCFQELSAIYSSWNILPKASCEDTVTTYDTAATILHPSSTRKPLRNLWQTLMQYMGNSLDLSQKAEKWLYG